MSKTTWTRIEKNLYLYEHQDSRKQWSRKYYGFFNDHKGIARRIPLSPKLDKARNKLGQLLTQNDAGYDFDTPKRERVEAQKRKLRGVTLEEFGERYFTTMGEEKTRRKEDKQSEPNSEDRKKIIVPLVNGRPKRKSTLRWERYMFENIKPHLGDLPLCEITKTVIYDFETKRVKESVTKGRRKDDAAPRYVGNETKFLKFLLNRAVDNGYLDFVPKIKISKLPHRKNDIKEEDYQACRTLMPPDAADYALAVWETGWRLNEPRKLFWNKKTRDGKLLVDLKSRVLRLDREDVKEDYSRVTPISPALRKVLLKLRPADSIKIEPVFARVVNGKPEPIKSIRGAWDAARIKAGIPNATVHDMRRSTIRRWEAMGIIRQAVMQATGHRPNTVHEKYAELSEEQLLAAFKPLYAELKRTESAKAV